MSSREKRGGTNSSTPSFFDICSFSASTSRNAASSKVLALGEHLGEQVPDLVRRQAAHRERQPPHRRVVHRAVEAAAQEPVEDLGDLVVVGQLVLDDVDLLLQVLGNHQARRNEEHVAAPVLEAAVQVAQAPDDLRPAVGSRGKSLRRKKPFPGLQDRLEDTQRVARVRRPEGRHDEPVHDGPDADDGTGAPKNVFARCCVRRSTRDSSQVCT